METGIVTPTTETGNTADIYTLDGRLIRHGQHDEGTKSGIPTDLPAGIYIMGHKKIVVK